MLTKYTGSDQLVVIPNDAGVTKIGREAFYKCESVLDVVIPEGVTEIGENAFYDCPVLTAVILPDSLFEIKRGAFAGSPNLRWLSTEILEVPHGADAIEYINENVQRAPMPKSLKKFGFNAFVRTPWLDIMLKNNPFIVINNILVALDAEALKNYLYERKFPQNVTEIADYAFAYPHSYNLFQVHIPDSVTMIRPYAFAFGWEDTCINPRFKAYYKGKKYTKSQLYDLTQLFPDSRKY